LCSEILITRWAILLMNKIENRGMRATWKDLKIDVSKEFTYNALDPQQNAGVIDHIFYNTGSKAKVVESKASESLN